MGKADGAAAKALTRRDAERVPELVNVELNLEEPPIFGGRVEVVDGGYREYVQEYRESDGSEGRRVWRWKPPEEYGELDVFDGDVYLAIHALAQEKIGGMPEDGRIPFTLYEMLSVLGLKDNGKNYRRVRDSMLKISKTLMDAMDAFYLADQKKYGSRSFIPWAVEFQLNKGRYGRATERHEVELDRILVRSLSHGHMKQLDVNYCLSLSKSYAKSLYKRIDYKRGEGLVWGEDLMVLKDHLGMPESYRQPSKVKEKLEPSHEELRRSGFLRVVRYEGERVVYEVEQDFVAARSHQERAWSHAESAAYRALLRNGVWANVARDLIDRRGPEVCNFYVDALPYQKNVRDSGPWLKKYIEERLPLPVEPPQRSLEEAGIDEPSWDAVAGKEPRLPRFEEDAGAAALWGEVLGDMDASGDVDASSLRVWFEGTFASAYKDRVLSLVVPNAFAKEYIESRFEAPIVAALRKREGQATGIDVVVGERG